MARAEKKVGKRLQEIDVENFLPLQRQIRQWHDRKKWVETVLFKQYIFVHSTEKDRIKVFGIAGVIKYLSVGGQISVLTNEEIERVKRLCDFGGDIKIEEEVFEKGEEVEIIGGHFIGMFGELLTKGDRHKLRLKIAGLYCFATVEIEKKDVRKIVQLEKK